MATDQAENVVVNAGSKGNYSITLDRLSICYNEPNHAYVQKTCGLLVNDHIQNSSLGSKSPKIPGMRSVV